ncbi:MAG TPA: hypothetical protein VIY47_15620, partial [Ignavibacteriaceae bacterium]
MILFIDTEFTDLVPGNKLISIALVDENEEYFYAELTDTYELKDCSDFVIVYVLPLLRGGEYRMSSYDCALKLGNWIEDREEDCILGCDNPDWDIPHLRKLLEPCWPENLHKNQYYPVYVPEHIEEDLVIENDYDIHNALDDAFV